MTTLYRMFDVRGRLLYVGISLSVLQRIGAHVAGSKFAREINRITLERFASREQAKEEERRAIRRARPVYNCQFNRELKVHRNFKLEPTLNALLVKEAKRLGTSETDVVERALVAALRL